MLNRQVVTKYWCPTCGYQFQEAGITHRPGKVLDLRIVETITGKPTPKDYDNGKVTLIGDDCFECRQKGVVYVK